MKLTFNFQTLVMAVLAGALAMVTAVWATTVYDSVHRLILHGFDRQLLALAGAAATLTDAEGHADYQRPYRIERISAGPVGLVGQDIERGVLVSIDPADGGALPLAGPALPALRSLAVDVPGSRLAALSADGSRLWTGALAPDALLEEVLVEPVAEEVVHIDGVVHLRRGRVLTALGAEGAAITLAGDVAHLSPGDADTPLLALTPPADAVVAFGLDGRELWRQPLEAGEHAVSALAHHEGITYLAAESLLRLEPGSATPVDDFEPGWYSERDPYFARHAPAYRQVREAAGLTFLYTQQHLGGDQIRYILDGSVGDDHSPPGYLDTVPEDSLADVEAAQARGQAFVSAIREWDVWGLIKVSAEPIIAADGRVVAMAGADVDIGVIREKTRRALIAVLLVGVGLLLMAGWVSLRVSQSMTRPVREIKDSALRIAAGDLGTRIGSRDRDELGELAESLDALANRLEAQARQAESYREALERSRLDSALDHALADLAADDGEAGRRLASAEDRVAMSRHATTVAGTRCLVWRLAAGQDEVGESQARARVIARRLLATTADASEAATHLASVLPGIDAVLAIDLAGRRMVSLGSAPCRVECVDAAGTRHEAAFAEGRAALPAAVGTLVVDGEFVLSLAGPPPAETESC
jgi:HAMP domain-containing protein